MWRQILQSGALTDLDQLGPIRVVHAIVDELVPVCGTHASGGVGYPIEF